MRNALICTTIKVRREYGIQFLSIGNIVRIISSSNNPYCDIPIQIPEKEPWAKDSSSLKRLQEHQIHLNKAYHTAKLIFDEDAQILKQLKIILDKFLELSSREQEILIPQRKALEEAVNLVQKAFSDHPFSSLQDIIATPKAFEMLNKLTTNQELQQLENEIIAFKKNELSDENLDNYFKPYINRIGDRRKKPLSELKSGIIWGPTPRR